MRNLRQVAWSATCFLDPEEAIVHLRHCATPDVLFVDNRMPRMDGTDFIDQLHWPATMMASRVYLCSGIHPTRETCHRVKRRGAGILIKDMLLDRDSLLSLLEVSIG